MKMNLLDMQKLGILNGEIEEEEVRAFDKHSVILMFTKTNDLISSEHNGKTVYPLTTGVTITEGAWICQLQPNKDEYRAKGIRKLDASFFMELKQGQKQTIIDSLWESSRDLILQYLEEKQTQDVESRISGAVEEAVKPLQEEIEQLKEENERLAHDLEMSRIQLRAKEAEPVKQVVVGGEMELCTVPTVRRISPDMIHCDLFDRPQYFAHISYDRKTLFIQPHDYGKTMCLNGDLYLTNLGNLVPYTDECDLRSRFVPGKGFYVYFD